MLDRFTIETKHYAGGNHYTIRKDGEVQPFGAIFFNKRGDIKRLVVKAVKQLNNAAKEGLTEVLGLEGCRYIFAVKDLHNRQVSISSRYCPELGETPRYHSY